MANLPLNVVGKMVDVLDHGWIELVDMMPNPILGHSGDMAIINAARVSHMGETKGEETDKKLLFYLMENGHTSPFEMVEMKFRVKLPLFVRDQWVRHRTWNFNIQSFRYSKPTMEFYHPSEWRLQDPNNKQGSNGALDTQEQQAIISKLWGDGVFDARTYIGGDIDALQGHFEAFGEGFYDVLVKAGVARELARIFIPTCAYTTMMAKIDVHNLMRFLKLRTHSHAQWEIQQYAKTIYNEFFKPLLPWTAEAFEKFVLDERWILI